MAQGPSFEDSMDGNEIVKPQVNPLYATSRNSLRVEQTRLN